MSVCGATKILTREVVVMPPGPRQFATAGEVREEPIKCETRRGIEHRCIGPGDPVEHNRWSKRHTCSCGWTWKDET